jgi:Raf kinase inhibitor-like YbhB/YbcL family protein
MRPVLAVLALLFLTLCGCGGATNKPTAQSASTSASTAEPGTFSLSSPAFADNTPIPAEYSCKGRNVPPTLRWQNIPSGTASLALVLDDPDASSGLYVHWVVTGIPPSTTEINDGQLPQGTTVGLNSGGMTQYSGPCPPSGSGVHHYHFQLYALSGALDLAPTTPARQAAQNIANAATAHAELVGLFTG